MLTTYGTMRVDHEALATVGWDLVVADEAQHVKNARSATARALRTIPSTARVALTGTPVENDLTELWAILDWATPGLLGSRNAFRRVVGGADRGGGRPRGDRAVPRPGLAVPAAAPQVRPGHRAGAAATTDTDHLLSLTREQVVLYEAFVRDSHRPDRAGRPARHRDPARPGAGDAHRPQADLQPPLPLPQAGRRCASASEKTDLLDEIVGTVLAEDGAVLVFTQYVAMARLLEGHLERPGVPHQLLHGGTPVREREAMVRSFQSRGGARSSCSP